MAPKSRASEASPGQQTISSFFSKSPSKKRKSTQIDLTVSDSDDDIPQKKLKSGQVKSSFFLRDSSSPERPVAGPSRVPPINQASTGREGKGKVSTSSISTIQSAGKWRHSLASSDEIPCESNSNETLKGVGKGKMKAVALGPTQSAAGSSFREKLRRRDLARSKKEEALTMSQHTGDRRPMDVDEEDIVAASSHARIGSFAAPSSPMPWGKKSGRKKGGKVPPMVGPAGLPCTDLEAAVIQFKKEYPNMVLLIQVGYKYCFFGDDAKVAGQVLGFFYGPDRNFLRTSFPVLNLTTNVKKLVAAGHKVGVISQIETAALKKAGDNRNTLFERKLTQLYTPATFVDDLDSQEEMDSFGQATPPLMCIVEEMRGGSGPDDKVLVGVISVVPSTGDLIYDEFEDTLLRAELETRLAHLRPCELLLPSRLSAPTEKMLRHFAEQGLSGRVRIERSKHKLNYTEAFDYISECFGAQSEDIVATIADLPRQVVIAQAVAVKHLSAFGLSDPLLQTKFFTRFTTHAHMLLNTSTVRNLEIYRNQTDFTEKGSLFSVLNATTTIFGKRMLKSWVGRPLVDKKALQQRVDAVEEARLGGSANLTLLRGLLKGLPDLARGLCKIQYGKCTPKELANLLTALNRVGTTFPPFNTPAEVGCSSTLWTDIIFTFPALKGPIQDILASINIHRARDNNKLELWTDLEKFPAVGDAHLAIQAVENDLVEELRKIRKRLRTPSLKFVVVKSDEYLIEIPKERASEIDPTWIRMGSTTKDLRFHTPEIIKLLQERQQQKETLDIEAEKAYKAFLQDIAQHYALFRDAVNKLSTADCLMSLATISLGDNFCKPSFTDGSALTIVDGRHPIIEQLKSDPFQPNTVALGGDFPKNLVITGPNMGGKSSITKMIALVVIMAQIGSYVPAESVSMSIHDTILTRMGASDDLAAGRSTFMVEIAETCGIIKSATPNSLVILDELGRGTSTFDGMAIAGAVLEHLAREIMCKTLFITHYPTIARELEARYPSEIANMHMSFMEDTRIDGRKEIRFLYRLTTGISAGSFGIECGRLAQLPEEILSEAEVHATKMQGVLEKRKRYANARHALQLLQRCVQTDTADTTMSELRARMQIMDL